MLRNITYLYLVLFFTLSLAGQNFAGHEGHQSRQQYKSETKEENSKDAAYEKVKKKRDEEKRKQQEKKQDEEEKSHEH